MTASTGVGAASSAWPYLAVLLGAALTSRLLIGASPSLRALARTPSGRYDALDSVRGWLACSVLACHADVARRYFGSGQWQEPLSSLYRFAGTGSVAVFFMITGLLFWGKAIEGRLRWPTLVGSRLRRIMPLYLLSAAMVVALCFVEARGRLQVPTGQLLIEILQWSAGGLLGAPAVNGVATVTINAGVTWTLQYEWIYYLVLPALAGWTTPLRFAGLVAAYLALLLATRLAGAATISNGMIVAVPFLGGMAVAQLLHSPWRPRRDARSRAAATFVVASFAIATVFYRPGLTTLVAVALAPAFGLLALGNDVFGLTRQPWARWLGHISFSIYLLHALLLLLVLRVVDAFEPVSGLSDLAYGAICAAISAAVVLVSSATYMVVERRFMTGRRPA